MYFVTAIVSMHRNVDITTLMLDNMPVKFTNTVRNLAFVFVNQLQLDEQSNNVKRKIIVNLINISRIAKLLTETQKLKHNFFTST